MTLLLETDDLIKEVRYFPGPSALAAHADIKRVKLAWGPVRSGKSVFGCFRIWDKCMDAAAKGISAKCVILRDTYRNLEDTTMKTWDEWFGSMGRWKSNQNVKDFVLRAGPEGKVMEHNILFRHGQTAQDASSFLSSDYAVIWIEEAVPAFTPSGLVSPGVAEDVFTLATTRLIQQGIDEPEMIITCNPPMTTHWVYRNFIARAKDDLDKRNWGVYFFPAAENEMNLRPGYYDELRRSLEGHDLLIKRFVDGEVVTIYPGLPVFSRDFNRATHVVDNLKPLPGKPFILGMDFGLTPACVWTQVDNNGRWLWLNELQGGYVDDRLSEQIGMEEFGKLVMFEHNRKFKNIPIEIVYGDPSMNQKAQTDEKTCAQILRRLGFKVAPGRVDIPSRVESIRGRMNTLIQGKPALLIDKGNCTYIIEGCAGGYRYRTSKEGSKVLGLEPLKNEFSHEMDAAGYAGSRLFAPQFAKVKARVPRCPTSWMTA